MFKLFAHAEELHSEETTELEHFITQDPIAVLIYAMVLSAIWFGLGRWLSSNTRLSIILAISLLVGLLAYSWTPMLSALAITFGFGCALVLTLATLGRKP